MKYKQLTITKRYQLLALKKLGYNQKEIAEEIGARVGQREQYENMDE